MCIYLSYVVTTVLLLFINYNIVVPQRKFIMCILRGKNNKTYLMHSESIKCVVYVFELLFLKKKSSIKYTI